MLEHLALRRTHVTMIGIDRYAQPLKRSCRLPAQLQPPAVHAVSGPIQRAARNALVRLDYIETSAAPSGARGTCERPISPKVADIKGVYREYLACTPAFGAAGNQGRFGACPLQCG